jgi:Lrp/AsnC family transcriptional regulator, regulator for asnA, asnC and gidA
MDDLDFAILALLQRDGRKPYTEIAQKLGVSEGTIRNRVYRLLDEQVIQIVGQVDPYQLGYNAPAIIGITATPSELDHVAEQIAAFTETSYLLMVTGPYDLIVEIMCRDREHLTNFLNNNLRKISGVLSVHTFFILRTLKADYEIRPTVEESNGI